MLSWSSMVWCYCHGVTPGSLMLLLLLIPLGLLLLLLLLLAFLLLQLLSHLRLGVNVEPCVNMHSSTPRSLTDANIIMWQYP